MMVKTISKYLRLLMFSVTFTVSSQVMANGTVFSNNINTLQVTVDDDFLSPAVVTMGKGQTVRIGFDEMSHDA